MPMAGFALGALQTACIVCAFAAAGLASAGLAGTKPIQAAFGASGVAASRASYIDGMASSCQEDPRPRRWLVDGFNVLHTGILKGRDRGGWWREPSRQQLLERAASFEGFESEEAEVWIVFDGPHTPGGSDQGARIHVVFAESADEWLLREVREAEDPAHLAVVTADRRLAERARQRGARVVAPTAFLARCRQT